MRQLIEADNLIHGDRNEEYGPAEEDFAVTAMYWSTYLQDRLAEPLTAKDVAMMMALLKIRREMVQHLRDNLVDACGYLALAGEISGEDAEPPKSWEFRRETGNWHDNLRDDVEESSHYLGCMDPECKVQICVTKRTAYEKAGL